MDSQPVDRNDTGVFEPAGDLRLEQKPRSAGEIVGMAIEDLLERHLAIQLGIECHEHRAQAPLGMRPQQPEPLAPAATTGPGGWVSPSLASTVESESTRDRLAVSVGSPSWVRISRVEPAAAIEPRLFSRSPPCTSRCLEASAWIRALPSASRAPDRPGSRPGSFPRRRRGVERGDQGCLIDQAGLKRQQTEQQISFGFEAGHDGNSLISPVLAGAKGIRRTIRTVACLS